MREYTRRPEEKPFPIPWLVGSKLDRPARLSCCWHLQRNCSQPTKIAQRKTLLTKFAHNEQIYCEQKFAQKICSRRIKFALGESNALHSTCNLSMDAWHDFYLHTYCSKRRKFAHSKEKLLTKIKFAQSKNLLKKICSQEKFAHRICSQHRKTAHDEKPCRLGWINTIA